MEVKQIKLYAVVVTYNGIRWIDKCLGSLKNSSCPIRTIVIDNASSDDTIRFIRSHYPEVILIENKENQGFGKANNIGIQQALSEKADYIYLLNQDAWVDFNVIERLAQLMEIHPEYSIISPLQYTGDGKNLDEGFQYLLSPDICADLLNDLVLNNFRLDIYPTKFVMAAHWLVRTTALKQTGVFLSLFKHYGEDKNLIHRMLFYGWKTGIVPALKGYHDREYRKESAEQKLKIQYARYLASAVNINKPIMAIFRYLSLFLKDIFLLKGVIFKRIIYAFRAFIDIVPIIKYRYHSKNTKNKDNKWR
jgi:GT2 family glycosyltransferase